MTTPLEACLSAWRDALGEAHVLQGTDADALLRGTSQLEREVPAVIRPGSVEEVRACVRAASQHRVALHAVSRGRNWGLGARLPHRERVAVMELSRMRAIRALDDAMGFATIEPGVTFAQLHESLAAQGARHFIAVTGSSPRASVLGNLLDRGDGIGPLTDRAAHGCAMEVVLADGSLIHTGFGRFEGSPLAPLHRWGLGPSLDGLFLQSNFGVVTAMTVWLSPLPRSVQSLRFEVDDDAKLPGLVDALRALRMEATLRGSTALWRDARVLSALTQHPQAGRAEVHALDDATLRAMCAERGIARWSGVAPMYAASEAQGRADRERAVELLAPVVDAWRCEERVGDARAGNELLSPRDPALAGAQGIPSEDSLRSAYWRKGAPPSEDLDPERDGCGVIWTVPAVPFEGEWVRRVTRVCAEVLRAHDFDPLIALTVPTPRAAQLVPLIVYDRDDAAQDQRARRCHRALVEASASMGLSPCRAGVLDTPMLPPGDPDTARATARLRAALDPDGVLSPGRYGLG